MGQASAENETASGPPLVGRTGSPPRGASAEDETASTPPLVGMTSSPPRGAHEENLPLRDSSGRNLLSAMSRSMAHISRRGAAIASRPYASMTWSPGAAW